MIDVVTERTICIRSFDNAGRRSSECGKRSSQFADTDSPAARDIRGEQTGRVIGQCAQDARYHVGNVHVVADWTSTENTQLLAPPDLGKHAAKNARSSPARAINR